MNDNRRKSPRANWIDYDAGLFFVTICTLNNVHYFGHIQGGEMKFSKIGEIVQYELSHPEIHHPEIKIPLFTVMPNHIHAIIDVVPDTAFDIPLEQRNPNPSMRPNSDMARHIPILSKYISSFKSAVSRKAHSIDIKFGWQPRYHDHLIRGNRDGNKIADYIINNPLNWENDCFAN